MARHNSNSGEKPTPEQRKAYREIALKNLKEENLEFVAAAFYANKENSYGPIGNADMHAHYKQIRKEVPLKLKDGTETDLMSYMLDASEEEGELYSGSFIDKEMLKRAAAVNQTSLLDIKVSDVLELVGSKKPIDPKYANKYLVELAESKDKKDQEMFKKLIANYTIFITKRSIIKASEEGMKRTVSGLEDLVKPAEPKGKDKGGDE